MISLRPYQRIALHGAKAHIDEGRRRVVIVAPTGAGKTCMGSAAVAARVGRGQRVVWFAHRRELCSQAAIALAATGLEVGHSGLNSTAPVQVLSTQTALARGEVPPADLVVLDEAHHYSADLWATLPQAYPDSDILGLTATPERGDGRPLDHLFNAMVVAAQPRQLVELGHLVRCETIRPPRLQPKDRIARSPVDAYIQEGLVGKRNIIFASHVKAAIEFAGGFRAKGLDVEVVHGALPKLNRDRALEAFRDGVSRILVNCMVLTEGYDLPEIDVVTIARKCGSQGMFIQMVGRGLRTAPGKSVCTLLDLCGVTHLLGDPLEDREFSLSGEGILRKGAKSDVRFCRVCGDPISPGEASCSSCGRDASDAVTPKATGDKLERFAVIRRDDDLARVSRLSKWIAEARGKNHKWQSALYRFKGAYGSSPTSEVVSRALALSDGRHWCVTCKSSKCGCGRVTA